MWLKAKYSVGNAYKNMKASSNISGKNNKKDNNSKKRKVQELFGKKVLLVNMSGVDKFCPVTGAKLPTNGMVVEYKGDYYANFSASARADQANIQLDR